MNIYSISFILVLIKEISTAKERGGKFYLTLYEIKQQLLCGKTIFDLPLKVVYYARVSTEKEEQINSLENQVSFFENYIRKNANWTFIGGYVDEGISRHYFSKA